MIPVYLITGFLGAGKTTFIKRFAALFPNRRLALIVNEFGRTGVDGALLAKLGAALKEVNSGSIFCACRFPEFERAVLSCIEEGAELLLIECSGLTDPADPAAVLPRKAPYTSLSCMGSICLTDAARVHKVLSTSLIAKKQIEQSDVLLLNKSDQTDAETLAQADALLRSLNPAAPILHTAYGKIPPDWTERLLAPARLPISNQIHTMDLSVRRSALVLADPAPEIRVLELLRLLSPKVHRVKGLLRTENGLRLADCVLDDIRLVPCGDNSAFPPVSQELTVLSSGLPVKNLLAEAKKRFPDLILKNE